jgi:hypothetical protein
MKGCSAMGNHQMLWRSGACSNISLGGIAPLDVARMFQSIGNCLEMTAGVLMIALQWFLFTAMYIILPHSLFNTDLPRNIVPFFTLSITLHT